MPKSIRWSIVVIALIVAPYIYSLGHGAVIWYTHAIPTAEDHTKAIENEGGTATPSVASEAAPSDPNISLDAK